MTTVIQPRAGQVAPVRFIGEQAIDGGTDLVHQRLAVAQQLLHARLAEPAALGASDGALEVAGLGVPTVDEPGDAIDLGAAGVAGQELQA